MKTARLIYRLYAVILMSTILLAINSSCSTPKANRPPVVEEIAGFTEWSPLNEGQFSVNASDPDGDNLTYTWSVDNATIAGNGATATWIAPATMGKYNIRVVVNDGKGHEVRGVKEVKVFVNADGSVTPDPPILLKLSLPSTDVANGSRRIRIWTATEVQCVVDGADIKDLKFTWTASNGKLQAKGLNEGTASKVTWIAPGVAGDYTVDVVVTDKQGNQAKGTANLKVFCCGN